MSTRSLGNLVVRLAVELAQYKAGWQEAEAATRDGVAKVDQANKGAAQGADALKDALKRQVGAYGEAAGGAAEYGQAAAAATGISTGLAVTLGAAAAAAVALGYAAYQGAKEQQALNNSLLLTGNYAGLVSGQLDKMAISVASSIGGTVGHAREVLAGLVGTGRFTVESLGEVSQAVQLVAQYSGQTNAQVLKDFAGMADGVAKWAAKSNEAYHFLDLATYRYIKTLEDQGDKQTAMRVTSEALSAHLGGDMTQNLGYLESGWNKVRKAASDAWSAMKGLGREEGLDERLKAASRSVEQARLNMSGNFGGTPAERAAALQAALSNQSVVESDVRQAKALAAARSQQAQADEAAIAAEKEWGSIVDRNADKAQRMAKEIDAMRLAGAKNQRSAAEMADQEAAIRERYAEKARKGMSEAEKEAEKERRLLAELSGVQADYMEHLSRLNRMRDAGTLSEEQYVAAVTKLIEKQPMAKALMKEQADQAERVAKATAEAAKAHEAHVKDLEKGLATTEAEIAKQLEHNAALGLSKGAVAELEAAKLEEQATALQGTAIRKMEKDMDQGMYDLYMREVDALRRLAQAKRDGATKETAIDEAKKAAEEWKRTNDEINRTLTDALMRAFESGSGFGRAFTKTIEDMFKTMVLRPVIAAIVSPISASINNAIGLTNPANAGSMIGNAGPLYSSFATSGIGQTIGLSNSAAMLGNNVSAFAPAGTTLTGLGAALPYLGVAMAAYSMLSGSFKGETRSGGQYSNANFVAGPSGGEINGGQVRQSITATIETINSGLKSLGSSATLTNLQSGFESSKNGKGFAYAGGQLSTGAVFGQGRGDLYGDSGIMNRRGSMSPEEAAAAQAEEWKQAMLQAWQAADVPGQLGEYLKSLGDIDKLSGGALDEALGRIQKALTEKATLEEQYYTLTHSDAENVARARDKERAALDESNRALYDQVAALVDQKQATEAAAAAERARAQQQQRIDAERLGLEGQLLQLRGETNEIRARERAALDESNRALYDEIQAEKDKQDAARKAKEEADAAARKAKDDADAAARAHDDAVNAALNAVDRAVEAQRSILQEQVNAVTSISNLLHDQIASLYGQVGAAGMSAAAGQTFIDNALSAAKTTGYLPDSGQLSEAIGAARAGMGDERYGSAFEAQRDRLVLAGKLSQLQEIAKPQLTAAQQQLAALETIQAQAHRDAGEELAATLSVGEALAHLADVLVPKKAAASAAKPASSGVFGGVQGTAYGGAAPIVAPSDYVYNPDAGVTFWKDGKIQNYNNPTDSIPSFAVGNPRVQRDMIAEIHRDEAVLTVPQAQEWRSGGGDGDAIRQELRQGRAEAQMQAEHLALILTHLYELHDRWDGGKGVRTVAAP